MVSKRAKDCYRYLPKKELQELCKRYGLSPNKTRSNLLNSLNAIFKASTIRIVDDLGYSSTKIRRSSRLSRKKRQRSCLQRVDSCDNSPSRYTVASQKISTRREISTFAEEVKVSKLPLMIERNVNSSACQTDMVFSSTKSSIPVPSFQFFVKSEDGINLFVDLDTNPSDWSKRLEKEVCICQNFPNNKFQSFRQELEYLGSSGEQINSSVIWNTDSETMSTVHVQTDYSPDSMNIESGHTQCVQLHGDDRSLELSWRETSVPNLEGQKILLSSKLNSHVADSIISDTRSISGDKKTEVID